MGPKNKEGTHWRWIPARFGPSSGSSTPHKRRRIEIEDRPNENCMLSYPWSQHFNDDGVPYYFNELSGQSQWELPDVNPDCPNLEMGYDADEGFAWCRNTRKKDSPNTCPY